MRLRRNSPKPRPEPAALHICAGCARPFVVPVSVIDLLPDGRCVMELACANCGRVSVGSHDDAALEAFDRELDATVATLHETVAVLELVGEHERVDAFAAALRDDLILPEDF
jgi:hypothetical protein